MCRVGPYRSLWWLRLSEILSYWINRIGPTAGSPIDSLFHLIYILNYGMACFLENVKDLRFKCWDFIWLYISGKVYRFLRRGDITVLMKCFGKLICFTDPLILFCAPPGSSLAVVGSRGPFRLSDRFGTCRTHLRVMYSYFSPTWLQLTYALNLCVYL